jgi:hypothetical protein
MAFPADEDQQIETCRGYAAHSQIQDVLYACAVRAKQYY